MKKIISIIAVVLLVVMTCSLFAACNNTDKSYDKITRQLKLAKSYEGKNFLNDGIGKATVDAHTDGDTTRFILENGGQTVIIRYYMINTPESTGNVEKWGKAASLFNKSLLSQPNVEIVLESTTGTKPEHDSYGTRWLGYVWYRTSSDDYFKCLNLELVENGFSENVSSHTDKYPYWEYFDKAEKFAKKMKLHIWSEEDDPLFNTEPVKMTLKDFWENTGNYYSFDTGVGSRVIVEAYLTDLYIGGTGTYNFTAEEYDAETGKTYSLAVYAQYDSSSASKMEIGHLYRFIGTVEEYPEKSGKFQLKGITYLATASGRTKITQENYYLTFNSDITSKPGYNITNYTTCFYQDLTVESATLNGTTLTIVGTAKLVNGNAEAQRFTLTVTVPTGYNGAISAGSVLRLTGLQLVEDSGNITVLNYSDITIVS